MKLLKLYIVYFFTSSLFTQTITNTELNSFYLKAEKICEKALKNNFCKAYRFYREQKYDSSYIFTNKALSETSFQNERDILFYIQGVNTINKSLYKKALKNIKSISNDFEFEILKKLKLGQIYLELKDYENAILNYKAWENNIGVTDLILKKNAYHNLGLAHIHKKEYKKAEYYFSKELNLLKRHDTLGVITFKLELANIYYNEFKDEDAIPLFTEAYMLSKKFSDLELKQNTAKNMAVVEKNRKRYKESIDYYEEYGKWKDSLWNRDQISILLERDKQIAIAEKDKEIFAQNVLAKKQKKNIQLVISIASVTLLFLGILYYFFKIKTKQNHLINTQKDQLEKLNTTKNYLFSVISHDLRSPVNALKKQQSKLIQQIKDKDSATLEKTANTTISLTESIRHLLNNVLHWSLEQNEQLLFNKTTIALQPLIQQVLFDFKSIATVKQIDVQTDLEATIFINVDAESLKIVFRNIIDNAIKYTEEKGRITITTKVQSKNECCIEIKDSGKGFSKDQLTKINAIQHISIDKIDRSKGVGLGLLLCNTMIKKNNGLIVIESELGKGTLFKIRLPLITNL